MKQPIHTRHSSHRRFGAVFTVLALTASACGGGSDDGGSSPDPDAAAGADFDPPSLTGAEICEMVAAGDVQAALGGDNVLSSPSLNGSGCSYSVFTGETGIGDVSVILVNNGGRVGYESLVDGWASRGDVTAVSGVGGEAAMLTNSSVREVAFFDGSWVFRITGPASSSFSFSEENALRVAKAVDAAV